MPLVRPAADPEFVKRVQQQVALLSQRTWYHSIELADGTVIPGIIGIEALRERLRSFPVPENLTGKRVLDVGAASGWCSFEMERRGADVVAVDCVEYEDFHIASRLLGSSASYRILDIEELTPQEVGVFDYVLFLGVLYHLRHPLLGLERICALTKEAAFVESFATDAPAAQAETPGTPCLLEFYEADELGGQIDNWFAPNLNCLAALCRSAGFARVQLEYVTDRRAGFTCYRHWEPPDPNPAAPAPWINSAVNNRTNDIYFHSNKDEYICLYFRCKREGLAKQDVRVEIDGYGVPVLVLANLGRWEGWQANMKVPPGLAPGSHEVRLRTVDSPFSNSFEIVVDYNPPPGTPSRTRREFLPLDRASAPAPTIFAVENSMSGTAEFHGYRNECLCCFFRTSESGLKKQDVLLEVDGQEQQILFLTDLGGGEWQTNSKLLAGLGAGVHSIRVRTTRSPYSAEASILFSPEGT